MFRNEREFYSFFFEKEGKERFQEVIIAINNSFSNSTYERKTDRLFKHSSRLLYVHKLYGVVCYFVIIHFEY